MRCERCGEEVGETDKVAAVDIDLSISQRYDLIVCEPCTLEFLSNCEGVSL